MSTADHRSPSMSPRHQLVRLAKRATSCRYTGNAFTTGPNDVQHGPGTHGWEHPDRGTPAELGVSPSRRLGRRTTEPARYASPARRRERLGHDVDHGQMELALGPMHEIELQPAGDAWRERADDESIVAGVVA